MHMTSLTLCLSGSSPAAIARLRPHTTALTALQSLAMRACSASRHLSAEAAVEAALLAVGLPRLSALDFDGCAMDVPSAHRLGWCLQALPSLRSLSCRWHAADSAAVAAALAPHIAAHPTLSAIRTAGHGLDTHAQLAPLFPLANVTSLAVRCPCLSARGAASLAQLHPDLQQLDLSGSWVAEAATEPLSCAFAAAPGLSKLCLRSCGLDERSAAGVLPGLTALRALRELDLSSNAIGNAGAETLAAVVPQLADLRQVRLGSAQRSAAIACRLRATECGSNCQFVEEAAAID